MATYRRIVGGGDIHHIGDTDIEVMFFPANIIPAFRDSGLSGGATEPDKMSVKELKAHIKSLGLKGFSKATTKQALLEFLANNAKTEEAVPVNEIVNTTPAKPTREQLLKMGRKELNEIATKAGIKNLLRKKKEEVVNLLSPPPASEAKPEATSQEVGATTADESKKVIGATEKEGHELFDEKSWTAEIKAKWKDNPADISPDDRPIRLTDSNVWKRPDPEHPFDMERTYLLPKLKADDPLVLKLRQIMDKDATKIVKVSKDRPGLGVGRTIPFGYIAPRTTWKTHPIKKVVDKGKEKPLKYREATLSQSSRKPVSKEMIETLVKIGRKINPLPFSTIQVNVDYQAKRHIDKGNKGLSMIFSLGDYEGGNLVINGQPININLQPLLFNGKSNLHEVSPILSGHRYSFVFYLSATDNNSGLGVPIINYATYVKTPEEEARYNRGVNTEDIQYSVDVANQDFPYEKGVEVGISPEVDSDSDNDMEHHTEFKSLPYADFNTAFKGSLLGEGRQHHYSVYMRHLDDAGLLPHMFGGDSHGKEGESRHNPPIKVSKAKVFNMKYDEDKLYELPPLSRTDPDIKALTEYMMENELPINKSRANSGIGRSQTIGRVRQKFKSTFNDSAFTKANPDLKTLLFNIGKKYNPLGFTSVQVNQNYECLPHIDKNNHGLSMIFAVGDYKGGELYINDKPHNIAYKPLIFNGAKNLHYVSKITSGNRFSFVYFTTGKKKT